MNMFNMVRGSVWGSFEYLIGRTIKMSLECCLLIPLQPLQLMPQIKIRMGNIPPKALRYAVVNKTEENLCFLQENHGKQINS